MFYKRNDIFSYSFIMCLTVNFITEIHGILFCAADPDDPLKTTDQTRSLGLIVSFYLSHLIFSKAEISQSMKH